MGVVVVLAVARVTITELLVVGLRGRVSLVARTLVLLLVVVVVRLRLGQLRQVVRVALAVRVWRPPSQVLALPVVVVAVVVFLVALRAALVALVVAVRAAITQLLMLLMVRQILAVVVVAAAHPHRVTVRLVVPVS